MGLWNTRRSGLNQTEQVKLSKIVLKASNNKKFEPFMQFGHPQNDMYKNWHINPI